MSTRRGGPSRLPWSGAAVLLLVLLHLLSGAGPAAAHAELQSADPADGATLTAPPALVTLQFSEAVSVVPRSIVVLDDRGNQVDSADPHHPGSDATRVVVALRTRLPSGTYRVVWRVESDDGHPVSGSYSFGIGVAPRAAVAQSPSTDGVVGGLHWLGELLALSGLVVLAGAAFFVVWLWPAGRDSWRARRVLGSALAGTLLGNLLLLLVGGIYGTGGSASDLFSPAAAAGAVGTTAGRLTAVRLTVLVLAALWWRHRDRSGQLPSRFDVVGLWLLVAVTQAVGGHPGHTTSPLLTSLVDVVHLTAVSTWIGGLALLVVAVLRPQGEGHEAPATLLRRWSRVAAGAVGVLVLSGAISALVGVGSWPALVGTTYGRLVLGKVAALLLVVAVAAFSRRLVTRVVRPDTVRTLRRLVAAETSGAVVVLGLTAALVSTAPGRETYVPSMSTTLAAGAGPAAVRLHVTVRPTTPGFEGLTVEATSRDGSAVPIDAARVRLVNPAHGIGPMEYPVATSAGAVRDVLISVPAPGRWDVGLTLRLSGNWVTAGFSYAVG